MGEMGEFCGKFMQDKEVMITDGKSFKRFEKSLENFSICCVHVVRTGSFISEYLLLYASTFIIYIYIYIYKEEQNLQFYLKTITYMK